MANANRITDDFKFLYVISKIITCSLCTLDGQNAKL